MESLKKGSDLMGGRGGKLGSNQAPLRNKEFKLAVDYTRVSSTKKAIDSLLITSRSCLTKCEMVDKFVYLLACSARIYSL